MSNQSFTKSHRLLTKGDFLTLKGDGVMCITTSWLRAYAGVVKKGKKSRLGISASKKVGNAVRRNRIKRIIRDCFRCSSVRDAGVDMLVVVNPALSNRVANSDIEDGLVRKSFGHLVEKIESFVNCA